MEYAIKGTVDPIEPYESYCF